ncbi:MAG: hypothetical protein V4487_02685 [Chlamydiota bacterium]
METTNIELLEIQNPIAVYKSEETHPTHSAKSAALQNLTAAYFTTALAQTDKIALLHHDASSNASSSHPAVAATGRGAASSPSIGSEFPPANGDQNPPAIPDPSVPTGSNNYTPAYIDKLNALIRAMSGDPGDMAEGQVFLQYLKNLNTAGLLEDPRVQHILDTLQAKKLIGDLIQANADLAFFAGFNGQTGQAGAQAWITQWLNELGNPGDTYLQAMVNQLTLAQQYLPDFTKAHTDASGDLIWTYTFNTGANQYSQTFVWDPTKGAKNRMISNLIGSGGLTGWPSSFWDNFNFNTYTQDYRMSMLQDLLNRYKGDPTIAITLFILMAWDNQYQGQLSGYANATDRQTELTNNYITKITNLFQEIGGTSGGISTADAETLFNDVLQSSALINTEQSTESYSKSWNSNFLDYFFGQKVTMAPSGNSYTLYDIFYSGNFSKDDLATALNSLNPPPGANPSPPPTALQGILSALQQAGGLVTQESKTLGTLSAAITNSDDQCIKVANFATDPSSGGYGGFMKYLAEHQLS